MAALSQLDYWIDALFGADYVNRAGCGIDPGSGFAATQENKIDGVIDRRPRLEFRPEENEGRNLPPPQPTTNTTTASAAAPTLMRAVEVN